MTRYATTDQEARQNARLDAFMHGQRQKAERGEETATAWRPPVDPLLRYVSVATGSPAEIVDRGDDPAMSAGWLRLTDREREDCDSPSPFVKAQAQAVLRRYVEADPESDPVARHYVEMARNAPRSAPPTTTPPMPVAEEAWIRAGRDLPYGASRVDRAHELEAEIAEERAAAAEAAEEEA
jgi:hypothetical protein